jgi:hypothetical protein
MDAIAGQRIEVWSFEKRLTAQETECVVALIVGENEQNVSRFAIRQSSKLPCLSGNVGTSGLRLAVRK